MQTVRISKNRAVLLLCDIQEKFMPTVYAHKAVQEAIVLSLKIANAFDLPVIATEHNPTVYGKMIPELTSFLPEKHHLSEKVTYSMIDEIVQATLKIYPERNQVILVGMETHVCLLQTFIDLKLRNYDVFLPLDAISSPRQSDRTSAILRMIAQGGIPTSVQSIAHELSGIEDEHFKKILALLEESGPRADAIALN